VIEYIEPIVPGSAMVQDFGPIAAGATLANAIVGILRLDDNNLLQVRWRPLDDVEGVLWLQRGQAKFTIKYVTSRVTLFTGASDPAWATTQFWVLGKDRDPYVEVRNNTAYSYGQSRFAFWGYRYILRPSDGNKPLTPATYVVAEGRAQ
jgi:hypothetical protein